MREGIILRCATCKSENYIARNDKKKEKVEVKKYCAKCNQHVTHRQKK